MRRLAPIVLAALLLPICSSMAGCKPDAAVKRGAIVGAGPEATEHDDKTNDKTVVTEPKTNQSQPLNKVQ